MFENMNVFFYKLRLCTIEILCFEVFFYCYSATYGPIAMKLCMAVKGHLTHVFTTFVKFQVLFRFYRPLGYVATPTVVNEPNKANQRTKFHFFSIIIDLESPEIITAVV